jgi:hypothetical protein
MYDAGWYQDPAVSRQGRYYDGTDWTDHIVEIPDGSRLPWIGEGQRPHMLPARLELSPDDLAPGPPKDGAGRRLWFRKRDRGTA